jgi:hypothetical protein
VKEFEKKASGMKEQLIITIIPAMRWCRERALGCDSALAMSYPGRTSGIDGRGVSAQAKPSTRLAHVNQRNHKLKFIAGRVL